MKKGIILYKSKYGATKKYAQWLAEETGYDCVAIKEADSDAVKKYDTIVFGSGIYASRIAGLSLFQKNAYGLRGKKLAIFCVGATKYDEKAFETICKVNLNDRLENVPAFYCRGDWDEEKMNFLDRTICGMIRKMTKKKMLSEGKVPGKDDIAEKKNDWTDKKYLQSLLEYLK